MGGNRIGNVRFFDLQLVFLQQKIFGFQRLAQGRTAMVTAQQALFAQKIDVAAHGLRGHIQLARQFLNRHKTVFAYQRNDAFVSFDFGSH